MSSSGTSRLSEIRREYLRAGLTEEMLAKDPLAQLRAWLDEVIREGASEEPTAITLATVSADGTPSARTVLLKGIDHGLTFFTNYESGKGRELEQNSACAVLFFWAAFERQVRVTGIAERMSAEESDTYFVSRPRESQIGAWASEQSRTTTREILDARYAELDAKYPNEVPRPSHWGGFRVLPSRFEFWQGRASRMHDRLVYERDEKNHYRISRLAP